MDQKKIPARKNTIRKWCLHCNFSTISREGHRQHEWECYKKQNSTLELAARAKRRYEKKGAKQSKQVQGEYLKGQNKAVKEVLSALEAILKIYYIDF